MQKWNFDCEQRSSFRWFYLRVLKCPSLWHACCMNKNYKFQFYTFKLMSKLTWQSWIPLHNLEGIIKLALALVPLFFSVGCLENSDLENSDPLGLRSEFSRTEFSRHPFSVPQWAHASKCKTSDHSTAVLAIFS